MKRKIIFILMAVLILSLGAFCLTACGNEKKEPRVIEDPVIVTQPTSARIKTTDSATFTVEMKNPQDVLFYQWQEWIEDVDNDFVWSDIYDFSARTNKLIIRSFEDPTTEYKYRCMIANKDGKSVVSDEAKVIFTDVIPVIKTQPQSVEVSFPDGATFNVEVVNPEDVATYQWQEWIEDTNVWKDIDETSAKTDTLVIESFSDIDYNYKYRCVITGKNKEEVISDEAKVIFINIAPVIKTQPKSVDINYPNGATFKVEVEKPEDVATYQWQEWLKGYGYGEVWNDMDGTSATTNELVIKSFNCECFSCRYRCVITNKNGEQVISNDASVNILNRETEFIPYVIVGEYGVKDGETLDLSDTPYGTGKVSFNVEGNDGIITLDNINYSNENVISSSIFASVAFELLSRTNTLDRYVFNLVGNNKIKNVLYEEDLNAAGIPICSNFLNGCTVMPMIEVSGNGFLDMEGGSEMIYSNTALTVDAKLKLKGTLDIWANGLKARDGIIIGGNCVIDCNDFNGSVVDGDDTDFEPCNLTIEKGAVIRGRIFAGKVGAGATVFYGFVVHGDMYIEGANINLTMVTEADRFIPEHEYVSVSSAFSAKNITIKDSSIVLDYDFTEGREEEYCGRYTGFDVDASLSIQDSFISINMDSPSLFDARGIVAQELTVNSSKIDLTVKARGLIYGINVHNSSNTAVATFNNSKVKIDAKSYDEEVELVYGLKSEGLDLNFVYETNGLEIDTNGIALAVYVEAQKDGEWNYEEGYVPVRISAENVEVSLPDGGAINQATMPAKNNIRYETVYDADKTTVSSHFILGYNA